MTTPAALEAPAGRRAAIDLAAIREQWGDLLAAIDEAPRSEWPPRDSRALGVVTVVDSPDGPTIGRVPLTLREHPAPLNLDALSAAVDVERALFTTADHIAHKVQRPARIARNPDGTLAADQPDTDNPARWHPAADGIPGSRLHGLHWCAVWLEGRALGEDITGLFIPRTQRALADLADVAHHARRTVEAALARTGRRTVLPDPCPWCHGQLTAHTIAGDQAAIVCATGEPCPAPVVLSAGSRVWQGPDLIDLYTALEKARNKAANA